MTSVPERLPVLVVDDDEDLARTLSDILELHGYSPVRAYTGREGLAAVTSAKQPVGVALVDLRLPDMDGLALADALKRQSHGTQVIILTGNASLESAVEALRHGSRDYLVKPVDPERLLQTVGSARERFQRLSAEDVLRRTHERHRVLLESLSEMILVLDNGGIIRYASPASRRMLGHEPDAWTGRQVFDAVHPEDAARVREKFTARVEAGGIGPPFSFRVQHADGKWRTVEAVASNQLASPEVGGVIVTVRDVTETRVLEEQLADARRMDSIGRLAGGVAHDFNNLLTVMLSSVTLLEQEAPKDPGLAQELREIRLAAESAARLTRQLLAFGRRQVLEPIVLDLNELIRESKGLLGRVLREDMELLLQLREGPAPVLADPAQLEQVLMNLVVNARDAMPGGGRVVIETGLADLDEDYVQAHPQARLGEHVLLSVTDTGKGMEESVRIRLFEPFFTTKDGGGTGLGLATVHGIVHQSGGNIWVYSEPGLGTTFKVYLPRASGPQGSRKRTGAPRDVTGTEQVLVVEDNEAVRRLVRVVLGRAGYGVRDSAKPAEALKLVADGAWVPQLLISDLVLPDMSGRVLADRLRADHGALPVLFISGFAHGAVEFHSTPLAPEHFLAKPFTADELLERVRRILDESIG